MSNRARIVIPVSVIVLWVSFAAAHGEQQATAPLTDAQIEQFLLTARMQRIRRLDEGVTDSQRATFSDGTYTHDAHVQTVDQAKTVFEARAATELNFKDSYRYNIAGYRLARLVGLTNVPVSVPRTIEGKAAAVTWWIEDVLMDERTRLKTGEKGPSDSRYAMQVHVLRVFDELIQNRDRNQGNIVWTKDWTMWMIDHTRAFRTQKDLLKPEQLTRIDRALFTAIKGLTKASIKTAVGASLLAPEIEGVAARAVLITKHFEQLIAERSEATVLFTMLPPQ